MKRLQNGPVPGSAASRPCTLLFMSSSYVETLMQVAKCGQPLVVDIVGCIGTEKPYVMVLRATPLSGVIVLCDFEDREIIK